MASMIEPGLGSRASTKRGCRLAVTIRKPTLRRPWYCPNTKQDKRGVDQVNVCPQYLCVCGASREH